MSEPEYGRPLRQLDTMIFESAIARAEEATLKDGKPRALVCAPWQASPAVALLVARSSLALATRSDCPGNIVYTLPLEMCKRRVVAR
jgi:hypothetical protein